MVPWIQHELQVFLRNAGRLKEDEHLNDMAPLTISGQAGHTSYKQHWVPENCHKSMSQSSLYEAGGSLFWLDPETGGEYTARCSEPSWLLVADVSENQFVPVTTDSGKSRILFPVPMSVAWSGDVPEHTYPVDLKPLGGHGFIYGWYVKMYKALDDRDADMVNFLVEAALSVTISAWAHDSDKTIALQSIKLCETVRVSSKVMVDSFISFMDKVFMMQGVSGSGTINQNCVSGLVKQDVRFNGGLINASMVKSMCSLRVLFTARSRELMSLLERRFGYEVLTGCLLYTSPSPRD